MRYLCASGESPPGTEVHRSSFGSDLEWKTEAHQKDSCTCSMTAAAGQKGEEKAGKEVYEIRKYSQA